MTPLVSILLAGCLVIGSTAEKITTGDLAPAFPGLESVPPDVPLGLAPAPSVVRNFRLPELRGIASRFSLPAPSTEICVERAMTAAGPAIFLTAMQKSLPGATIEILEYSRRPIPAGEIQFPISGLRRGSAGSLWTGYASYGAGRRYPVWARVRAQMSIQAVVAATDLRPGQPIGADQLRLDTLDVPAGPAGFVTNIEDAAGKWPRVPVRAGSALRATQLRTPKDVVRGDTVRVAVQNGLAYLELDATAEESGEAGAFVRVRNRDSNRLFVARVEGKGRVSVDGSARRQTP